jgi:hypothetical protein
VATGPYLILAAFWLESGDTEAVAEAVRIATFPVPPGYPRGAVVAFRRAVAEAPTFQRDLARFNLADLNERPA